MSLDTHSTVEQQDDMIAARQDVAHAEPAAPSQVLVSSLAHPDGTSNVVRRRNVLSGQEAIRCRQGIEELKKRIRRALEK